MATPTSTDDYETLNKANWDERAPEHATSPSYALDSFRKDPTFLSKVIRFDLPLLPALNDKDTVHLQCHIGTDTLSLARLGAKSVTGLDFSSASVSIARDLAASAAGGEKVKFVESDVYSAVEVLGEGKFDVVFTGIGAICWIPSITRWAEVVAKLLRPGGRLFVREGHPVLWALDDEREDGLVLRYPYFETEKGNVYESAGTYVDLAADSEKAGGFQSTKCVNFNHGLGEIVTALLGVGMKLELLREWKSVPWRGLVGVEVREREDGEWELADEGMRDTVPLSYTLVAVKE